MTPVCLSTTLPACSPRPAPASGRRFLKDFLCLAAGVILGLGWGTGGLARSLDPKAEFGETEFAFSPVVEGTDAVHDFVVGNSGPAELRIRRVKADCGCTTASYPQQIPPGGGAKITIRLDTDGYGGQSVNKSVVVFTNDPAMPRQKLRMKGRVVRFVTVSPPRLVLRGEAGQPVRAEAAIIPEKAFPFGIIGVRLPDNSPIRCDLTRPADGSPGYLLTVENLKSDPGRYHEIVELITDSKVKPKINVSVFGRLFRVARKRE